mmetsp:Transcript_6385/g.24680  ORF Transcript_6385/g.24680 Transcript_6385/m.24680 type:complete len:230 (+) Transcript_6385:1644-2333(+)
MPRDDPDERRVPVPEELHGLPQVSVHLRERGGVPRDPGRSAPGGWGHRQPGHNRVPERVPRRPERDVHGRNRKFRPGTRREGQGADEVRPGVPGTRDGAVYARRAVQGPGRGDTDARQRARVRRGEGLLRARHRRPLSLRPERPALRQEQGCRGDEARDDVHDRADGERGDAQDEALAGRVDGGDGGWRAERAVRAHHGGDGNRPGRSHETHRKLAPVLLSIVIDVVLG